jgi:transposase
VCFCERPNTKSDVTIAGKEMARQPHRKVKSKDGRSRKSDNIRKDVEDLISRQPLLSGKQIAERLGLSQNTVSKYVRAFREKNVEARQRERLERDELLKTRVLGLWDREFVQGGSFWSTSEICAEMKSRYGISPSMTRRTLAVLRKEGSLYERAGDRKWPRRDWLPSPEMLSEWEHERQRRRDAYEAERKAKPARTAVPK